MTGNLAVVLAKVFFLNSFYNFALLRNALEHLYRFQNAQTKGSGWSNKYLR